MWFQVILVAKVSTAVAVLESTVLQAPGPELLKAETLVCRVLPAVQTALEFGA